MSKIVIDSKTTQHASCRIYIFNCSYNNLVWQNDPLPVITVVRDKLDRITGFTYKTLKIISVKKAINIEMEIHIGDITYNDTDRLSVNSIDFLRLSLQQTLSTIPNFLFERIDIVADMFLDQPTAGYVFDSMTQVLNPHV